MTIPTVVGVGAFTEATTGATTYPWPGGYTATANDIAYLVAETNVTGGLSLSAAAIAAGWAHVTNSPRAQGSNVTSISVFGLRLVGGEAAPDLTAAADHQDGAVIVVGGGGTTGNLWDFTPVGSGAASGSGMSATGGTTTVADTLVLIFSACSADLASTTNWGALGNVSLSSLTTQVQGNTANGNGGGVLIGSGGKAVAGATGTTTATITTPGATSNIVLAIPPAAAAAAYPFELLTPTPRYF